MSRLSLSLTLRTGGRGQRPRPCWAPPSVRPAVASQLIREFIYLYGAVSPMDGACSFLILPAADTECFQIFLDSLGKRFSRQHILLILDGAPNHTTDDLLTPANIALEFLPPCSPELNPQENIWDEIREKIFKNYALKSMDEVCDKPEEAALYITLNATQRWSNPSRPFHISSVQCDVEMV
jgi:transposase